MTKDRWEELYDLVRKIDEQATGLTEWERKFISDMVDDPPDTFSPNQIKTINNLYDNWC